MSVYRKGIFVVPDWVEKSLMRRGESVSRLLSLSELNQVLSLEDLACVLMLNQRASTLLGARIEDQLILEKKWMESRGASSLLRTQLQPMLQDPRISQVLTDRLFDAEACVASSDAFSIVDVDGTAWAVVIRQGGFSPLRLSESSGQLQTKLCRLIHDTQSMDELARTNLFVQWVAEGHHV